MSGTGAGQELLGCLILLRAGAAQAWTEPEIDAVESLGGDIGRGLEHARLYEGEEHLVAELESLGRAKASFLASASHDLRTPLTSIIGFVELLADQEAGPIRPAQAKMLDGVDRNARRLGSAVLSVADSGIGIPEEDQDSMFTRFFRASNAVEAAIPGSGLGLSIVRTIVVNHHGELSIKSGRDRGTTVTVRIPLGNGAVPAAAG